jgi:hypothetical protein
MDKRNIYIKNMFINQLGSIGLLKNPKKSCAEGGGGERGCPPPSFYSTTERLLVRYLMTTM